MHRKLHLPIAVAAGFLGGFLSRYMTPAPVFAQSQTPAPKQIRAQDFVVVDNKGDVVGTFTAAGAAPGDTPAIVLIDRHGKEVWRAGFSYRALSRR